MVGFGFDIGFNGLVWFQIFHKRFHSNNSVSTTFKWLGLNGLVICKLFGSVFIMYKWFGLVWFHGQETEIEPKGLTITKLCVTLGGQYKEHCPHGH